MVAAYSHRCCRSHPDAFNRPLWSCIRHANPFLFYARASVAVIVGVLYLLRARPGFKKVKGGASSRPRSAAAGAAAGEGGAVVGVGSAAAGKDSESWEEFRHPQFRRGRRDLLVGIKRQKDGGRLKRKRGKAVGNWNGTGGTLAVRCVCTIHAFRSCVSQRVAV